MVDDDFSGAATGASGASGSSHPSDADLIQRLRASGASPLPGVDLGAVADGVRRRRQRRRAAMSATMALALVVPIGYSVVRGSLGGSTTESSMAKGSAPEEAGRLTPQGSAANSPAAPGAQGTTSIVDQAGPDAVLCPAAIPQVGTLSVPEPPTMSEARSALVPRGKTLTSAVICRYPLLVTTDSAGRQATLSGHVVLTGDLAPMAHYLAGLPRKDPNPTPCPTPGGDQTAYLVRLTWSSGEVSWLTSRTAPIACALTSNGVFASSTDITDPLAKSFTAGRWISPAP